MSAADLRSLRAEVVALLLAGKSDQHILEWLPECRDPLTLLALLRIVTAELEERNAYTKEREPRGDVKQWGKRERFRNNNRADASE